MTQPTFVPIAEVDQVRPSLRLRPPGHWTSGRPGDLHGPRQPAGKGFGAPGPDQGYAMLLARRFTDRLRLSPIESPEDVVTGTALLASRRAALFGRAPSVYDVQHALGVFGFLSDAPPELVAERSRLFGSVSHDYDRQRALVDSVPEETLRLAPQQVTAGQGSDLTDASGPGE